MNKLAQTLDKTGIRDWDFLGEVVVVVVGLLFKTSGSTGVALVVVDFFELELFKFVVFSVKPEGFSRGESCNKLGVEFFNPTCFG